MTTVEIAARTEVARLADQLERSFRGGAWHGPAVAETLSGVDAAAARRRTVGRGHTIDEIVGHLAFWLDAAARRLDGEALADLPPESDWPAPSEGDEGWRGRLAELETAYRRLHARVLELDDAALDGPVAGSDPTVRGLLLGILQHNAYHGGQIALLAKPEPASAP